MQPGNPADGPRLKPAVERVIKRTRQKPRTVTADRGYGEASIEAARPVCDAFAKELGDEEEAARLEAQLDALMKDEVQS